MLINLKRKYRAAQQIIECYFPRWTNIYWQWRHILNPNWAQSYLDSIHHPHRKQIVDSISKFQSINSIAEIGCAAGANLVRLVKAYPNIKIIGVDISHNAI